MSFFKNFLSHLPGSNAAQTFKIELRNAWKDFSTSKGTNTKPTAANINQDKPSFTKLSDRKGEQGASSTRKTDSQYKTNFLDDLVGNINQPTNPQQSQAKRLHASQYIRMPSPKEHPHPKGLDTSQYVPMPSLPKSASVPPSLPPRNAKAPTDDKSNIQAPPLPPRNPILTPIEPKSLSILEQAATATNEPSTDQALKNIVSYASLIVNGQIPLSDAKNTINLLQQQLQQKPTQTNQDTTQRAALMLCMLSTTDSPVQQDANQAIATLLKPNSDSTPETKAYIQKLLSSVTQPNNPSPTPTQTEKPTPSIDSNIVQGIQGRRASISDDSENRENPIPDITPTITESTPEKKKPVADTEKAQQARERIKAQKEKSTKEGGDLLSQIQKDIQLKKVEKTKPTQEKSIWDTLFDKAKKTTTSEQTPEQTPEDNDAEWK